MSQSPNLNEHHQHCEHCRTLPEHRQGDCDEVRVILVL